MWSIYLNMRPVLINDVVILQKTGGSFALIIEVQENEFRTSNAYIRQ